MTSSAGRNLGRYRLERLVGRGGMAEVWEARDQTLGRRVAVKIILPDLAREARFHDRFLSEARSVAALDHEHVLPIYDFGEAGGEPYLVMPFLENGTLAERIKRGDVEPALAIEWIRQLSSALDAAHAASVLHRDVKPANVMLGGGGRLLLADFGLAKSNQSGDLTATGLAMGTPAYMAPELARGEPATTASDRYALGVLAYELLCGRPPFVGDNALALLHQHLTTPVPAVVSARSDLPDDLDPAFARILAKDAEQRPASCAALASEIERAFGAIGSGRTGISSTGAGATAATSAGAPRSPAAAGGATDSIPTAALPAAAVSAAESAEVARGAPSTSARRRLPILIGAIAGALAVIAACWLLWESRQPPGTAPPTAIADHDVSTTDDARQPPAPVSRDPSAKDGAGGLAEEGAVGPGSPSAAPAAGDAPSHDAASTSGPTSTSGSTAASSVKPPASTPAPGVAKDVAAPDTRPAAAPDDDSGAATATGSTGTGHWALPPAEALAISGRVADAWRQGRFRPELFDEIGRRSASMRAATPSPGVELLERWIEGGQALARGEREAARAVVAEFHALSSPPEWVTLLPGRFLAHHAGSVPDWQVALFWADPRNEARALVEIAIAATPGDRNLPFARAVVEHLDGKHAEAARQAVALETQLRTGRPRQVLVRFAGDQLLWSGQIAEAISWYKKLLVAPDRTEIGAVLRTLSQEGGPQLVARACADGFKPACEAGRPLGPRARRARQQP